MSRSARILLLTVLLVACQRAGAPVTQPTEATMAFDLTSSAFGQGAAIPRQHTCDGADQSLPLSWTAPPTEAQSLAIIVEDPDAPDGTFVHWVIFNLPVTPGELAAGVPRQSELPNGARQGR